MDAMRSAFGTSGGEARGRTDAEKGMRVGIGKQTRTLERGHRHRSRRSFATVMVGGAAEPLYAIAVAE